MPPLLRALLGLVAIAAAILLALPLLQRRLLYYPDRYALGPAEREANRIGLRPWRDADGGFLGWHAPHPSGAPVARVVVLHGNAGSALDRGYLRDVLQAPGVAPLEVFLLEYPGYGPRGGTPSQRSIVGAAVEGIDALGGDGSLPILLAGESLGSAAVALATVERPAVAGCLLLTPLKGVPEVARRHLPWLPSLAIRDRFDAAGALARYRGPVAFLVAGADEVVFPDLGQALHDGFSGPKRLWIQEGRGHNTVRYEPRDPMWREMIEGLLARRF